MNPKIEKIEPVIAAILDFMYDLGVKDNVTGQNEKEFYVEKYKNNLISLIKSL